MTTTLSNVERLELATHRAHLRASATLSNIRQRLELLETSKPLSPQQAKAKATEAQQEQVEEFWTLAQTEQETHPDMTAAQCRQRVLKQHPEFKAVYPKVQ